MNQESEIESHKSTRYVRVASVHDVRPGGMKGIDVEGEPILLCNVDGEYFAVRDECTHECFPLSAGDLQGEVLTCALHGASFDVGSGEVLALPAYEPLKTYAVRIKGDEVLIALD